MFDLAAHKQAQELRECWQAKAVACTRGKMAAVVLSVIAHSYDDALETMLRVVFPGFRGVRLPFFVSAARISHTGRIACNLVDKNQNLIENYVVFESEAQMQKEFRVLADELKLKDHDRIDMFGAVGRWIVADLRQNPLTGEKDKVA